MSNALLGHLWVLKMRTRASNLESFWKWNGKVCWEKIQWWWPTVLMWQADAEGCWCGRLTSRHADMAQNANLEKNIDVAIDVVHHDDNDLVYCGSIVDMAWWQISLIDIRRAIGTWMCIGWWWRSVVANGRVFKWCVSACGMGFGGDSFNVKYVGFRCFEWCDWRLEIMHKRFGFDKYNAWMAMKAL